MEEEVTAWRKGMEIDDGGMTEGQERKREEEKTNRDKKAGK